MPIQQSLLTATDFKYVFNDGRTLSHSFAQIIKEKLGKTVIICGRSIFKLNAYNQYKNFGESNESVVIAIVSEFLSTSYNSISKDQMLEFENEMLKVNGKTTLKQFYNILTNGFVKRHVASLKMALTNNEVVFDEDKSGIHFKNGRYNLKTNKLEERTPDMLISQIIDREFKEPSKKCVNKWVKTIKMLFENEDVYKYMINGYGSMLDGDNIANQRFFVNYGKGSAGKTTLLKFIESSLSNVYYKELKKDSLCVKNNKVDKIMNTFNNVIRYYVINEIDTSKIDIDLLKGIADGRIEVTRLYQDGSFTIYLVGTIVIVSNNHITFPPDSGINRRLRGYEYKHIFTDDSKLINNKTHFKKDKRLIQSKYHSFEDRNAIFKILADECYKFNQNKGEMDNKPKAIKVFEDELIDINDDWAVIIDDLLVKKKGGFVLLEDVVKKIRETVHNKSHIQRAHVLSAMKDRGIKYDKEKMHKGKRGCFLGYVMKSTNYFSEIEKEEKFDTPEIERLKCVNEKLAAFIASKFPDCFEKIMDELESNKDLNSEPLTIESKGTHQEEEEIMPKKTKQKKTNSKQKKRYIKTLEQNKEDEIKTFKKASLKIKKDVSSDHSILGKFL